MNQQRLVPRIKFRVFKDVWKKEKLGNLSDIVRGASPRPIQDKKWFSKDSNIGWLRISDVTEQNGKIYHLEQKISLLGQEKTRVVKNKHLLLSIAATVGSPVINYIPTGVHDGFLIFLNPQFNIDFMFQWLTHYKSNWAKYSQPGSQVNLNSKIVKNQQIYIPKLNEQQKIGALFSKLDRLLELQHQKLYQLELLKKALLQKLFPKQGTKIPELRFKGFEEEWKRTRIRNIVQYNSSSFSLSELQKKDEGSAFPVYDAAGTKYYSNKFDMQDDYIAIIKDGSNVGKTRLLPAKTSVLGTMGYLKAFDSNILFDFYSITNTNFDKYKVGSGIPHIYFSDYKRECKLIPKIAEQQKIGNLLSKVDRLIELENKKNNSLKLVKKSLLQNMFVE